MLTLTTPEGNSADLRPLSGSFELLIVRLWWCFWQLDFSLLSGRFERLIVRLWWCFWQLDFRVVLTNHANQKTGREE